MSAFRHALFLLIRRMKLGYNTNGLNNHDPLQAIDLVADAGYESLALTVDHGWLSPWNRDWRRQLRDIGNRIRARKLATVVETGARFLLDPRRKHWPPLVAAAQVAQPRIDLTQHCFQIAAELGSSCVSIWSGPLPDSTTDAEFAWQYLVANLESILESADRFQVDVGFEPEPGMFVDTLEQFAELRRRLPHPRLRLTMDIGHLWCQGETPIAAQIHRWRKELVNIHIEDMRAGVHEHLAFGQGEIDFPPVIRALHEIGYSGGVHVELSRHSHEAPRTVQHSFDYLMPLVRDCRQQPMANVTQTPRD